MSGARQVSGRSRHVGVRDALVLRQVGGRGLVRMQSEKECLRGIPATQGYLEGLENSLPLLVGRLQEAQPVR